MAKATPRFWLLKSEPSVYPFSQLEAEGRTAWTGVRNFEARNNLRAMSVGDLAFFYHSGEGKEIVGLVRIASRASSDPTAPNEDWAAVDVEPVKRLAQPVSLSVVKKTARLKTFPLIARSRLSVAPVTPEAFEQVLLLGKTRRP